MYLYIIQLVGHASQRPEPHVDFGLPGRTHSWWGTSTVDTRRHQRQHDLRAQVLQAVHGGTGK